MEVDKKRKELLTLASNGEISRSVMYIKKASAKVIERIYAEYESRRLFLTDLVISKFSAILGGLEEIETPEEMEKQLKVDPLLRKDMNKVLSYVKPLIPFLGIFSGGITVGQHVWKKIVERDQ